MWGRALFGFLLAICAISLAEERQAKEVKTPQGSVKGYKEPGDNVYVFYGIPYATAPKGPYKFRAPLPAPAWFQTFEAVNKDVVCPQLTMPGSSFNKTMHENCLIANVYVPDTEQKKLPVVVYVHGGGYYIGFSDLATPKNLVRSKKVIAVNFNYRLGVYGFLCLGTKDAPGNAGLKDQVALLRWVRKNIASYGGNPDDVTIAGYSAGSSSVDLLMLSKSANGLFNKVIPESGANLTPLSIQLNPLESAKTYARSRGFENVDDVFALEEFYKTATFEQLTVDEFLYQPDNTFPFSPCVENNSGDEPFLTDSPYNILRDKKYNQVPMLYGFAEMEGLFRLPFFETWSDKMNTNFSEFLPGDLEFVSHEEKEEVAKRVKSFYFGEEPLNKNSVLPFIDYFTDVMFAYPTMRAVKLHAQAGHNKIYLYEYSFVDESEPPIPHTNNLRGANHGAQSIAVSDGRQLLDFDENTISEDFKKVKTVMREIWLNFITTGNPVPPGSSLPPWPPAQANGSPHMSLGKNLELRGALLESRANFWHEIYDQYYRFPVPPPKPPTRHSELSLFDYLFLCISKMFLWVWTGL